MRGTNTVTEISLAPPCGHLQSILNHVYPEFLLSQIYATGSRPYPPKQTHIKVSLWLLMLSHSLHHGTVAVQTSPSRAIWQPSW